MHVSAAATKWRHGGAARGTVAENRAGGPSRGGARVRVPHAGPIGSTRRRNRKMNDGESLKRGMAEQCRRAGATTRPVMAGAVGGDGEIAWERGRVGCKRARREEWLGRLTGPEPVFDLVQPCWTKDQLVILQKISN